MGWEKKAPNKKGYWIRLNAIHRPEIVFVNNHRSTEDEEILSLFWGWGGEKSEANIDDILHKIEHFYWWQEPLAEFPPRDE